MVDGLGSSSFGAIPLFFLLMRGFLLGHRSHDANGQLDKDNETQMVFYLSEG